MKAKEILYVVWLLCIIPGFILLILVFLNFGTLLGITYNTVAMVLFVIAFVILRLNKRIKENS